MKRVLALAEDEPPFSFFDEAAPIYTRARYLPPSQVRESHLSRSVLSEGCLLDRCQIVHCVLGLRLRVEEGAVLRDTLAMGADSYESDAERRRLRADGGVPLGIGPHTVIQRAILDKNVRIGSDVKVINKDRVEEADRNGLGFTIRNGIVVIEKNATIADGTVI